MPASMREQLEEAFNDSDQEDQEEQEEVNEEVSEEITEETGGSDENTQEPVGDTPEEEEVVEKEEVEETEETETTIEPVKGKPPASWKPSAREHWGKIPEEAQREIARREKHMDNMIRESSDSRKHQQEFNELIRPFEPLITSQNSTPFAAVKNLMTTAAGLTLGTPEQKARVVSSIMREYGVDVEVLDNVLVGNSAGKPQGDPGLQQMLQQELAPIRQFMGDMNTQRQSFQNNQQNNVNTEIDTFAQDSKNEFFGDVRETMADLMEISANRGQLMTIQEAYDSACRMDPDIYGIVSKRQMATNAAENKKSLAKKRHAASSIQGNSAGTDTGQGSSSIAGALNDAWDDAV